VSVPSRAPRPDYLKRRMSDFDPNKATRRTRCQPGLGPVKVSRTTRSSFAAESTETTHFSVVDAAGNAVATTYTLNGKLRQRRHDSRHGHLMNKRNGRLHREDWREEHVLAPAGSRQRHRARQAPALLVTPTMVFKDGKLLLVTGSPAARRSSTPCCRSSPT